jgi:alpha-galactosidase
VDYPDLAAKPSFLRYAGARVKQALSLSATMLASSLFMMSPSNMASQCANASSEVVAAYTAGEIKPDAAHPSGEWQRAVPATFCSDWRGKNADPARETRVRVLWSRRALYFRFECHYRELNLFADADPGGRRDHLWDRDVAEVFLQPDPSRQGYYKEFEVSPNGMWIDLDIFPGGRADLKSGLRRSVVLDDNSHTWTAELALPMTSLTPQFDPSAVWRANFYRVEGTKEPRAYTAWQPTGTPQPNFHVPSAFGELRFAPPASL